MVTVLAPMTGWVAPLGEVPDPVFADKIMGDGVAIDPTDGRIVAPCNGVIATLAAHAFTIRAASGIEILTHVGLDTVALKGEGFKALAREGQVVKAGDPVLMADLDFLARNAKSLISPVIVVGGEGLRILRRAENCEVVAGAFLLEIAALGTAPEAASGTATVTAKAVVASEHGLHARPSALIATTAKRFAGEITLTCRGRSANAKSATAIMSLGVHQGDEVAISAPSRAATDAIVAVVAAVGEREHRVLAPALAPRALPSNTATRIHGIAAAPGRAVGVAVQMSGREIAVVEAGRGIAAETKALREAIAQLRARLERTATSGDRVRREILSAHVALLDDPDLVAAAEKKIGEGKSAAFAFRSTVRVSAERLRTMDDMRMRERAGDLVDLERQVLALLTGATAAPERALPPGAILIAEEILPSDLKSGIAGFVSSGGGPTSHAAILAAGMNIPALVGAGPQVLAIREGGELLLNADDGFVDLAPDAAAVADTRQRVAAAAARRQREQSEAVSDCVTADGVRVEVFANLGKGAAEAAEAVGLGAEGCGVLRTEFLFMDRETPPSEDEQFAAYQGIADALAGRPFIIRTFDIGADKPVPYLHFPPEDNPQLGLRGVRTASVWPELLTTQLKAAARVKGQVRIMLPMITAPHEIRAIRTVLAGMGASLPLGAMVETPSAGLLADQLVADADFLSIGTNDLTQYVLAIDRGHRALSGQLDALHPAVLRLIARASDAANAVHKSAAVCGGLAADLVAAPILIGLGISELSVPPPVVPRLKAAIRRLNSDACRTAARAALELETPEAVRALVKANFVEEDR
ncbi:phosphoenolpyruvate--protein phosphotransferase [Rhizomicrobium electricum]|uniref:phosphoenolpyruvate--protein phosphotransferase n=1 Tax=Rhizomicrobium electricum TaxID=480070 RepID=A0ABN1EU77_9PROT|nr:phosphoenolpyruvate--protein phosphotransferase [Rhizomicrobium electricum]NIJ49639.1 phosphocarrier protein FPr/phosphocarrier protein [Rhizomicrobium electricum]